MTNIVKGMERGTPNVCEEIWGTVRSHYLSDIVYKLTDSFSNVYEHLSHSRRIPSCSSLAPN